jgi:hypothetical protein
LRWAFLLSNFLKIQIDNFKYKFLNWHPSLFNCGIYYMVNPEHILRIFNDSVIHFKPNYIRRFSPYDSFKTTFPTKEDFFDFFSDMLLLAKKDCIGILRLKIETNYPTFNEGFTAYNYYDELHLHPVFKYEVRIEDNITIIGIGPF